MPSLSTKLPADQMQSRWAAQLNPILANRLIQGQQLTGVLLGVGATSISHSLGQAVTGWFITDSNAPASVYRSQPLNNKTLTLTSNATVTVSLWVY